MAQIGNFDATQVAPATAPEALPAGWYTCVMSESEMKPTQDGTGAYLSCTFEVIQGEHTRSKIFDRINLQNKNPVAVEIGYRTLSAICHAVGVMQVNDSALLHNRPLQVRVSLRPAGPGADGKHYDASNEVKGYKGVEGAQPGMAAPAPVNIPQPVVSQQFQPAAMPQYSAAPPQQPAVQQYQPAAAPAPLPWQQPASPAPMAAPPLAMQNFDPAAAEQQARQNQPVWNTQQPEAPVQQPLPWQQAAAAQPQHPAAAQPQQTAPTPPWQQPAQ